MVAGEEGIFMKPPPKIRKAFPEDMAFIKECIEKFRLDDENLNHNQFVVAVEGDDIVGFGRIRPHKEIHELGCVGVVEYRRNRGIGEIIVEHLINIFPANDVYITTDFPEYFAKFGFKKIEPGPKELEEKLKRVCKSKRREGAVVMVYNKKNIITMIRQCNSRDFETIYGIINNAARAYKGVIPSDRWKEPYMSKEYLQHEIEAGVVFWGYAEKGRLVGVMGIQDVQDVTLIRHAYVRTSYRNQGIGSKLIFHLKNLTSRPTLVGTWTAAVWAIRFYEKHGFRLVSWEEKEKLLRKYWSISERQTETSVVLADPKWFDLRKKGIIL